MSRTYNAQTTANVISTAGDATLSVADPSPNATGRLVNGAFSLADTGGRAGDQRRAGRAAAFAPVGGSATPTTVLTYGGPVSNDAVTVVVPAGDRRQRRAAHGQLRQDADVHVVDHDTVMVRGPRRSSFEVVAAPGRGPKFGGSSQNVG